MLKRVLRISLFALVGCMACTKQTDRIEKTVIGYDDTQDIWALRHSVKDLSMVQLEAGPQRMLRSVSKLSVRDTVIYISDTDGLYAFGTSGRFLRKFGEKGNAENEYISLATFLINPAGGPEIVDSYSGKIITFAQDGSFVKSEKYEPDMLKYVQDGEYITPNTILFSHFIYNDLNTAYTTVDTRNKAVVSEVKCPLKTLDTMEGVGRHPLSACTGEKGHYLLPFSQVIYPIGGGAEWKVQTTQTLLSDAGMAGIEDFSIMTYFNAMQENKFMGFTDIFETEDEAVLLCKGISLTIIDKGEWRCRHYTLEAPDYPFSGLNAVSGTRFVAAIMPSETKPEQWDVFIGKYSTDGLGGDFDKDGNPIIIYYSLE